jgi:hypothetical protein
MKRIQVIGLFFLIGGVAMTILNWRFALADGEYYVTTSFLAPFAACIVLRYPPPLTQTGAVQQRPWKDLPTGQKALFGGGILAGVFNLVLISGVLNRF